MKKILFAALAALAITSCSQNEIDGIDNGTPKSKNEIGVNTIVKKSSRATVTSNSSFTSFKLHAYIIKSSDIATSGWGNAYMDGIEYKGGQGNWTTTSGTFYWPITEMQFFGYTDDVTYTAPASSSAYPTISYTLPDTPADQKDIIVAYSKDITKPSDNTLNLTFQHILTRINFAAKLADSNYTYTVESITITGAKGGAATYTFGPRHVCRFGDGGQIHDLVLLQQPPGKLRQRRDASRVQSQLGQTLFQNGFQIISAPSAGPGSPPAAPQWWDRQAPPARAPHPSSSGRPACSWLSPAGTWQRPR